MGAIVQDSSTCLIVALSSGKNLHLPVSDCLAVGSSAIVLKITLHKPAAGAATNTYSLFFTAFIASTPCVLCTRYGAAKTVSGERTDDAVMFGDPLTVYCHTFGQLQSGCLRTHFLLQKPVCDRYLGSVSYTLVLS